jgi:hypothetical protein
MRAKFYALPSSIPSLAQNRRLKRGAREELRGESHTFLSGLPSPKG